LVAKTATYANGVGGRDQGCSYGGGKLVRWPEENIFPAYGQKCYADQQVEEKIRTMTAG
jgi:hypothetical protein